MIGSTLKEYIEKEIIPLYDHFDGAHRRDHVQTVINESMKLAEHYDVDLEMVYAIAAFHDTGLQKDRKTHHLVSGEIIRNDAFLRTYFSPEKIETMAQAAEDHRASSDHDPRSVYGKIVAEADRIIDQNTIVRRTIQYGMEHYPELDREGHFRRFCQHMKEKYADGGYLKLWIPESPNAARLERFREKLRDPLETRRFFDIEWEKLTGEMNL